MSKSRVYVLKITAKEKRCKRKIYGCSEKTLFFVIGSAGIPENHQTRKQRGLSETDCDCFLIFCTYLAADLQLNGVTVNLHADLSARCTSYWIYPTLWWMREADTHPFQLLSSSDVLKDSVNLLLDTPGPVHHPVDKHRRLTVTQCKTNETERCICFTETISDVTKIAGNCTQITTSFMQTCFIFLAATERENSFIGQCGCFLCRSCNHL